MHFLLRDWKRLVVLEVNRLDSASDEASKDRIAATLNQVRRGGTGFYVHHGSLIQYTKRCAGHGFMISKYEVIKHPRHSCLSSLQVPISGKQFTGLYRAWEVCILPSSEV